MNWGYNSSQSHRLFVQHVTLPVLLLVPIAQMHAQTQVAMNAQARAEFVQADTKLNKTYEALLKKLPDGQSKEKLKQSQRAWLAFRDAEAAFATDQTRGGSMAPTIRYQAADRTHWTTNQTAKDQA
jgi:uncharacterized protein YecT (DUF1311 family)